MLVSTPTKRSGDLLTRPSMVFCIPQSVMHTEIGRSLETEVPLKKIEERFCRQLKKEGLWENIHQ